MQTNPRTVSSQILCQTTQQTENFNNYRKHDDIYKQYDHHVSINSIEVEPQ